MKKIKSKISIIVLATIVLFVFVASIVKINDNGPKKIRSASQLAAIYGHDDTLLDNIGTVIYGILAFPWIDGDIFYDRYYRYNTMYDTGVTVDGDLDLTDGFIFNTAESTSSEPKNSKADGSNDFSTTNIQVENVDEADIIKTDGEYIYSLSDNQVIITDARDPENPVIVKKLSSASFSTSAPEEILLYNDKLIVIGTMSGKTTVEVYDITSKENPVKREAYSVNGRYYTSRLTKGKLYVISTGSLNYSKGKVDTTYTENSVTRKISYNDMYYFKDKLTSAQTTISTLDLDKDSAKVDVTLYLLRISNLYVSENNMYLVSDNYSASNPSFVKIFFGLLGPRGALFEAERIVEDDYYDYSDSDETQIYKFELNNGKIKYAGLGKVEGDTIDQFSLDEYNSNLRVALYTEEGSKVAVFNDKMKLIGESEKVAQGEKMYSSRFIGQRGYLVTYLNTDPLFCFDLSNPKKPEILGELQISGYSTYLHPYDENHIIGIGMETKETVSRNNLGKVTSTTSRIIGMKMALFDVSDVNNPKQISQTVIGDSYTTSAILTNPKALLFSKEKELIAIPVNNYKETFVLNSSSDEYTSIINSYKNYNKTIVAEGYLVYKINLTEGFNLKGVITHEKTYKSSNYYSSYAKSKLLRGLYIDNNLYTVSEDALKVNDLNSLDLIKEIKIKGVK